MTRRNATARREPNGQIQREKEYPPTQVKRLRDAALAGLRDEQWGTELGRLFLIKAISAEQYAAGKRWAEQAQRYKEVIGIRALRSPGLEIGVSSHDPDPQSEAGLDLSKVETEIMAKFTRAHRALLTAGMMAERYVRRVCEDNESLTVSERMVMACGLTALVDHYALTNRKK